MLFLDSRKTTWSMGPNLPLAFLYPTIVDKLLNETKTPDYVQLSFQYSFPEKPEMSSLSYLSMRNISPLLLRLRFISTLCVIGLYST